MQSSYITSAQKANQLPQEAGPEVAFLGRSNCGKSSLINALVGQKDLARTSSTPGRTQMANFFHLSIKAGQEITLVDLPGYGFSKVPRNVSKAWDGLLQAYLSRTAISGLAFLMDCRRKAEPGELDFLARLRDVDHRVFVVLTKADKINRQKLAAQKASLEKSLSEMGVEITKILTVSSLTRKGLDQVRDALFQGALEHRVESAD